MDIVDGDDWIVVANIAKVIFVYGDDGVWY
jgi:hypothetical protein